MADVLLLSSGKVAAAEPTLVDAAAAPLLLDTRGRLLVSTKPSVFPLQSAPLTVLNDALAFNVEDSAMLVLHVKNAGTVTLAAGTFVFEASLDSTTGTDGTWFPIQAARSSSSTIEVQAALSGIAAGAVNAYGWRIGTAGYRYVRVRCSVAVTASAIALWQGIESPNSVDPVPSIGSHAVTGSGNFTIVPATGTVFSQIGTASINAAVVKASGGNVTEISIFNGSAATIYVKLFDKATTPAPATDAALVRIIIPVAAGAVWNQEFGILGKRFANGIGIVATAAAAATDVTVIGVGSIINATYL